MIELMELMELLSYEHNKYFKWYWKICDRAKDRILPEDVYTERHHIYPKSIYGKNANLVKLTAKEHYIAHLLLWRGLRTEHGKSDIRTRKMAYAFVGMNFKSERTKQRYDSKTYVFYRIACSESSKNRTVSNETRQKMSESHKGIKFSTEVNLKKGRKGKENGMYGKTPYDVWTEKYGKDEAEERRLAVNKKNSEANTGNKNGMYGKKRFDIWVEKYGVEEAIKRQNASKAKNSELSKGRSCFKTWTEKYGKEEAERRRLAHNKKISNAHKNKKKKIL